MMEPVQVAMAGQEAGLLVIPAQVVQETRQALRRPKAQTVVEVLIPAHIPEQVAAVAVRQVLRVVLDQAQAPARVEQELHQASADRLLLMLAAAGVVLLKMEQVLLVALEAAALAATVVT